MRFWLAVSVVHDQKYNRVAVKYDFSAVYCFYIETATRKQIRRESNLDYTKALLKQLFEEVHKIIPVVSVFLYVAFPLVRDVELGSVWVYSTLAGSSVHGRTKQRFVDRREYLCRVLVGILY